MANSLFSIFFPFLFKGEFPAIQHNCNLYHNAVDNPNTYMKYFSVIIAWKLVIALKVMILADSFFFCLAWKGAVRDLTVCLSIHGLSTTSDVTGLPLQVHLVDNHSLSSPYYLLLPMTF